MKFPILVLAAVLPGLLSPLLEGQSTGTARDIQTDADLPRLMVAEVPFYPSLAWAAKITGRVVVRITVEQATVKDAVIVSSPSPALSEPTIANIKTWRFASGDMRQGSFVSTFEYVIEGKETVEPETPKVQIELPRYVKVTARPVKPTCSDCPVEPPARRN